MRLFAWLVAALLGPTSLTASTPRGLEPGASSQLQGIYCTSRSNCWAVGSYRTSSTVILNEVL